MTTTNKHIQVLRKSGFTDNESAMVAMEAKLNSNELMEGEIFIGTTEENEVVLGISSTSGGSVFYNSTMTNDAIMQARDEIIGDLIFV